MNYIGFYENIIFILDNYLNLSYSEYFLLDFNVEIFYWCFLNIIFILVMMIFGVIGNFVVFYVYFIRLNCKNVE